MSSSTISHLLAFLPQESVHDSQGQYWEEYWWYNFALQFQWGYWKGSKRFLWSKSKQGRVWVKYMYASKMNMINMTNSTTKHSPKCPLMVSLIRTLSTIQHNTLPMILGTFKISWCMVWTDLYRQRITPWTIDSGPSAPMLAWMKIGLVQNGWNSCDTRLHMYGGSKVYV